MVRLAARISRRTAAKQSSPGVKRTATDAGNATATTGGMPPGFTSGAGAGGLVVQEAEGCRSSGHLVGDSDNAGVCLMVRRLRRPALRDRWGWGNAGSRKSGLGGVTEKRMVRVRFVGFRPSQREAGTL